MIRNSISIFVLFCLLSMFKLNAQFIIAGQHSTNDYYHNYTLDTVIKAYNPSTYSIDINNDGINDFIFTLHPYDGAMGETYYYYEISGQNNNKVAFAHYDSCFDNSHVFIGRFGIAHAFTYNDTINAHTNWDSLVYLKYILESGISHFNCGAYYSSDSAYIGLKVINAPDTLFGWIKIVSLFGLDTLELTIGAYACNKEITGTQQIANNKDELNIFPNPATDIIYIEHTNNKAIKANLFDVTGKQVNTVTKCKNQKTEIDITGIQKGVYILKITINGNSFNKKIVIE